MPNDPILLVDDEPKVLSSLSRTLIEEDFNEIHTAASGSEALGMVKQIPGLAVIVSDFHMPGMSGTDLLAQARLLAPDTTRILLTGVGDLEMAVEAVNRGHLFRFLLKPCPAEVFTAAILDGVRQNQLVTAERELLSNTLNGSVKVMIDILAATNPEIFAKTVRLRKLAREMARALQIETQAWEVELAALLCQIGAVTVPRAVLLKAQNHLELDLSDKEMLNSIPKIGAQLIKHIPRLENIANAVAYQASFFTGQPLAAGPTGTQIPLAARILKIIIDFDTYRETTRGALEAFQLMLKHQWEYDPEIMGVFEKKILDIEKSSSHSYQPGQGERKIPVEELRPGMELARDVLDRNGILIVSRGTIVSEVLRYKLINYFHSHAIVGPVFIESDF